MINEKDVQKLQYLGDGVRVGIYHGQFVLFTVCTKQVIYLDDHVANNLMNYLGGFVNE